MQRNLAFPRFGPLLAAVLLAGCGSGSGSFTITAPPANLAYPAAAATYSPCLSIAPNTPSFDGAVQSFAVAPPLPAGLQIDPLTGSIQGTPSAPAPAAVYTVTATGFAGSTSVDISIEVSTPPPLSISSYGAPAPVYTAGVPIAPNGPTLLGVANSFSATPALPAGLVLDPATGVLSGTPTAQAAAATYTVRASNCLGEESTFDLALTVLPGGPGPGSIPRFLYVANEGDNTLSRLELDPATGLARHRAYLPVPAGPRAVAVGPLGGLLFCLSASTPSISVFQLAATDGHPSPVPGSPFPLPPGSAPRDLLLSAAGDRLYVSLEATDQIAAFAVAPNGALTALGAGPVSVVGTGSGPQGPHSLVLSPSGDRLFASLNAAGGVASVALVGNGQPSDQGQAFAPTGAGPRTLAVTTGNGGEVYVLCANTGAGSLTSLAVGAGGTLTPVVTASFGAGAAPDGIELRLVGSSRVLFVPVTGFNAMARVLVSGASGQFSPPVFDLAGPGPSALAIAEDGSSAWVLWSGAGELTGATLQSGGTLVAATLAGAPVDRVRLRPGARALAIASGGAPFAPTSSALYTANFDSGDLSQFAFDPGAEQLSPLAPAAVDGGVGPNWVWLHPRLPRLYAVDRQDPGGGDLRTHPVGTGGALGAPSLLEIGDVSGGSGALTAALVESSGRFLYAVRSGDPSEVVYFQLDAVGAPTAVGSAPAGRVAQGAALDPTGQFLALANSFDNTVQIYRLDPLTGSPVSIQTAPVGSSPFAVAFDPTGRFVYVANRGSGDVSALAVNGTTGALAPIAAVGLGTGSNPAGLVVERFGRILFVAAEGSGQVERLLLNTDPGDGVADGTPLAVGSPTAAGGTVRALALDAGSTRLFAGVQSTGEVRWFALDAAADGALTPLGQTAAGPGVRSLVLRRVP